MKKITKYYLRGLQNKDQKVSPVLDQFYSKKA